MLSVKEEYYVCPRIDQATIDSYVAQADFLIAYFHMLLIKCYGPVVLVKELPVLDTPKDNLLGRTSYDECVQWTCDMFDDAAGRLPATRTGSNMDLQPVWLQKLLKPDYCFMQLLLCLMVIQNTIVTSLIRMVVR